VYELTTQAGGPSG